MAKYVSEVRTTQKYICLYKIFNFKYMYQQIKNILQVRNRSSKIEQITKTIKCTYKFQSGHRAKSLHSRVIWGTRQPTN